MSVRFSCCVLSGKRLCEELRSLVQMSATECGVSEFDQVQQESSTIYND